MRKTTFLSLLALAFLFGRAGLAIAGPIVVNGSFEDPIITTANGETGEGATPPVSPVGWTHTGDQPFADFWRAGPGTIAQAAGDGHQFVTMGADGGGTAHWTQTLHGLTPGTTYDLTFMMSAEHSDVRAGRVGQPITQTITVDFSSGGAAITGPDSFSSVSGTDYWNNWVSKGTQFLATAADATLRFSATTEVQDVGLDNVRVELASAVPEPASLTLAVLGGLALGGYAVRRRQG